MKIPKFLVGDNTECPDAVFIIHTESPRFILNLDNDDVKWLDDDLPEILGTDDEAELTTAISELLALADEFYQKEIDKYEESSVYFKKVLEINPKHLATLNNFGLLLKKIKMTGFNWIGMGIESGNQTVRQEVSKGSFKVVDINDVLDEVRSEGISIGANFIFGFPDDNFETVNKTLDLAKKINAEFSNVYPCMALPGSPIHKDAIDKGWDLPSEYSEYGFLSYECKPLPTKYMTNKEVIKFRDEAWLELNTDKKFLCMIESKFGSEAKNNIIKQSKINLNRRLLEQA